MEIRRSQRGFGPWLEEASQVEGRRSEPAPSVAKEVSHGTARPPALSNGRFGAPEFANVNAGFSTLQRGSRGPSVTSVQEALLALGYALPEYGADARYGRETASAVERFQRDHHLAATGVVDSATLRALDGAAPPPRPLEHFPEYGELFKDGVLTVTLGVGYDEEGADLVEREQVLSGLAVRGFRSVESMSAEQLQELGIHPESLGSGRYFARQFAFEGRPVTALIRYVDRRSADPKAQFAAGISSSDLVLYGGHARYGSGPDFDSKESNAGNFVLGVNAKGHRDGTLTRAYDPHMRELLGDAPNDLERTRLKDGYQLMVFVGCSTDDYFDELRGIPSNKSRKNLDLVGSTGVLSWWNTSENVLGALDAVMAGKSVEALQAELLDRNRVRFRADGFDGNRYQPGAHGGRS